MNWTNELLDLYEKNQDIAGEITYKTIKGKKGEEHIPLILLPVFHTTVTAQIEVTIDENGEFLSAKAVDKAENLTMIPVTEKSLSRTAGTEPHPLCDNLKYLAGDYMVYYRQGKKQKDYSENYRLYIEALQRWHESPFTHKKVDAIYAYVCKGCMIKDLATQGVITSRPFFPEADTVLKSLFSSHSVWNLLKTGSYKRQNTFCTHPIYGFCHGSSVSAPRSSYSP